MALIREGLEVVEFPYYVTKDARAFISATLNQVRCCKGCWV